MTEDVFECALKWARKHLTPKEVGSICRKIARADTSAQPDQWTPKMPLWGHCAMVVLLVHEIYGGQIWRQSLAQAKGFEHFHSHYSNTTASGEDVDLTIGVLRGVLPPDTPKELRERVVMLGYPHMAERYELFRTRFFEEVIRTRMPTAAA